MGGSIMPAGGTPQGETQTPPAPTTTGGTNWGGQNNADRQAYLKQQREAHLAGGGNLEDWRSTARGQAWRNYNNTMDPNNPNVGMPAPPPAEGAPPQQEWGGYGGNNPMGSGWQSWMQQSMSGGGGGGVGARRPGEFQQADWEGAQKQIDKLYGENMRLAEPQLEQMRKRHEQDLINKGIDPNSEQGQQMLQNMQRGTAEIQQQASANAIGQGMGFYDQLNQTNLAARGQDAGMYGAELGANTQRYLGDQAHQRGMGQLALAGQGQDFNQMLGLENLGFRDRQYADSQNRYQDQMIMSLLGYNPMGGNTIDPSGAAQLFSQTDRGALGKLGL